MTLPEDDLARVLRSVGGMRHYILDDQNVAVPVDLMTWAAWFQVNDHRRIVARDDFGGVVVSTVFLGLDHAFGPDGPRLIYETLVFGGTHAHAMDRYATWAQAVAGHAAMVRRVRGDDDGPRDA